MSRASTVPVDDQITPAIRVLAGKMQNLTPVNRSIGVGAVALAKHAFDDPSSALRPCPLAVQARRHRRHAEAFQHPWRFLRGIHAARTRVTIGSDRRDAAIHQLGVQTKPQRIEARRAKSLYFQLVARSVNAKSVQHPGSRIPACPFFPVTPGGGLTAAAQQTRRLLLVAYLRH